MSLSILVSNVVKIGGVVTSLSKAISTSKIDALITYLEDRRAFNSIDSAINAMKGLEKESEQMIPLEEAKAKDRLIQDLQDDYQNYMKYSIPLSTVEAIITELEEHHDYIVTGNDCVDYALFELRKLLPRKKPPSVNNRGLKKELTKDKDYAKHKG